MILYGWLHKAYSQSQAGLEQYYYMDTATVTFNPIIWYQANSGWYAESRYNYEADKTLSAYVGKTFENQSTFSYSFSPMLGAVAGGFNGGSIAVNTELKYKKLFFSSQSQYTFSLEKRSDNFIYNWCDIGYTSLPWLSAGISLQQTNLCDTKSEKGFFIKAEWGSWVLPLYIFNPQKSERYTVLGLNFSMATKKNKRPKNTNYK